MVNSGSFDSADGNRNGKKQGGDAALGSQSSDAADDPNKNSTLESADGDLPCDDGGYAIEPTPTKTEINSTQENEFSGGGVAVPLEKVEVLEEKPLRQTSSSRKLLCLYCDRTFVSANLRQKHVERVHSVKSNRRVSARRQNQQLCTTPCSHCDKLNSAEHTLSDLFQHLVQEHSAKYYGCISCEDRFLNSFYLSEHNRNNHFMEVSNLPNPLETNDNVEDALKGSITRSKLRSRPEEPPSTEVANLPNNKKKKKSKLKDLRNKKISIKTSKIAIKRSTRLQQQAKELDLNKKRKERKLANPKPETIKLADKSKASSVNPYPEFDSFYRVKKITDHSIDNLKISSLTFDDVFDKAFFNRIKCNIEENLLHHIDGKLFKNEESESRISNFEKVPAVTQEIQNQNSDNYGCDISLNAITPASALSLNSQFGEDFESQIEYGSKPSKKKTQLKSDEVHYKYFTRRKYQASILLQKENRDLSKLDMWTQMLVKERQERMLDKKKSSKELQEYTSGQEYKSKIKREELNRILDRRGPFEDLKEEATKKAAFDKLNSSSEIDVSQEVFSDVREVLNDLLDRVFQAVKEEDAPLEVCFKEIDKREIPAFLNLRRKTSSTQEEMDKSDKIALICSSQETENFELPTNAVRGKNEIIELTGEWARSRMYICAACGGKFSNMKYLLDHKSLYHQNVWVQHYEFVGNQSELYRHLSIPNLGKVGYVEETIPCKQSWKRSEARLCTKCGKRCNSLGELHRHLLECGGDWTWMLARKKLKYRPVGGKTRRKRKVFTGFEPKNPNKIKKTETAEKKTLKKPMDGPRQRPSDADTIQRMLANLPAKRMRRNIMSLSDVVFKSKKPNNTQKLPTAKVKRGRKSQTEKNKSNPSRALRSFGKVLSSRILDINSSLMVKRKIKVLRSQRLTRNSKNELENSLKELTPLEKVLSDTEEPQVSKKGKAPKKDLTFQEETKIPSENAKKSIGKRILTSRLNLKNFFPVKKRNRSLSKNVEKISQEPESEDKKSKYLENFDHTKNNKRGGLKGFVRALSLRKRNSKDDECSAISESLAKTKISRKKPKNSTEDIETPKKRKLQQSFRKVINKVKKINSDKFSSKPTENQPFLEQTSQQDSTPQEILTPKENIQDKEDLAPTVTSLTDSENPPIPETIFNLSETEEKVLQAKGELDFDVSKTDTNATPVCIDSSIKPPLLSPNVKGKMRKPSRGLNDCIAMLTTKLQQKDDKLSLSRESLFSTSSTTSIEPRNLVDNFPIPILPTVTVSESPIIETALDLSKKSVSTPDLSDSGLCNNAPSWTSVDDIIQKVIEENTTANFNHEKRSHLDDTIDFVINTSLDWFEIRHPTIDKHYKKPRRKRHSSDDLITNIIFGKDKLIIAPSSNPEDDDPLIARIKENELKMSMNSSANALTLPGLLANPFLATPFLPIILNKFSETQKPQHQENEAKQTEEVLVEENADMAIIDDVEVKSAKKPVKSRKGRKPKSIVIETNIDDQMDFKEVENNEPDVVTLPAEASVELNTENEPTVLENKIITKPVSDSEDEVPLARIAKQEETHNQNAKNEIATKNDMVETLTTDSLKENIEAPKEPTLIAPTAIKKIRRKKRKKIYVRQKRHLLNKPSVKVDALLESNTNLPNNSSEDLVQCEEAPNKEAPTKLLNSQRTRRKSKSSKKIDTVDNDLFKNFSLVINKKTKRIPPTSIVDDSVCDDINFFVKPLSKEVIQSNKLDSSGENLLNDSVEEMDMELEDLPDVNIIIERDASLLKEAFEPVTMCDQSEMQILNGVMDREGLPKTEVFEAPKDQDRIEAVQDFAVSLLTENSEAAQDLLVSSLTAGNSEALAIIEAAKPTPKKRGRPKKQTNQDKVAAEESENLERPLKESTPKRGRPKRSKRVSSNELQSAQDLAPSETSPITTHSELAESIADLPLIAVVNELSEEIPDVEQKQCNGKIDEESSVPVEANEAVEEISLQDSDENNQETIDKDRAASGSEIEPTIPKRGHKKGKNKKKLLKTVEMSTTSNISNKDEERFVVGSDLRELEESVNISPVKRRRGRPSKNQTKSKPDSEVLEISSKSELALLPLIEPIGEALEDKPDQHNSDVGDNDISELPLSSDVPANKDDADEGTKSRRSRKVIDYNEDILEKRAIEISTFMINQDKKVRRSRKNVDEPVHQEQIEIENLEFSPPEIPAKPTWEEAIVCNVSEFSEIPKLVVDIHHKDQIELDGIVLEATYDAEIDENVEEPCSSTEEKLSNALDVYNFEDAVVTKKAEKKKRRSRKSTNSEEISAINDQNYSLVEDLVTLEQKLEALENESYSRYQKKSKKNVNYNELLLNAAEPSLIETEDKNSVEDEPQILTDDPEIAKKTNSDLVYTEPSCEELNVVEAEILNNNKSVDLLNGLESVKDVFDFEESTSNKGELLTVPMVLNNNECAVIELESASASKPKKAKAKTKKNKKNQKLDVSEPVVVYPESNEDAILINEPAESELDATQKAKGKKSRKNKMFGEFDLCQFDQETESEAKPTDNQVITIETQKIVSLIDQTPPKDISDDNNEATSTEIEKVADEANNEIALKPKSDFSIIEAQYGIDEQPEKNVFDFTSNENVDEANEFVIDDQTDLGISEAGNNENSLVNVNELEAKLQMETPYQNEVVTVDAPIEISQEVIKENGSATDAPKGKRRRKLKKNNMDIDVTNILDTSPRSRKSRSEVSSNFINENEFPISNQSSSTTNQSEDVLDGKSTAEKLIPDDNLLEETVLETKSLPASIKHIKKRKTTKNTKQNIDDSNVEADHQQQLAKINIKDLLLSSFAPPDSTYERDFSESTGKKPKIKKPKHIFEENSSSLKNISSFDALKNVLDTITTTENMFSEMPPLSEIISSSEMDIAPVLDEIDKSLESEDIYDFNDDSAHKKCLKKKIKTKSAKKPELPKARKSLKSSGNNEQETIEKEVADILNTNNKEEAQVDQSQLDLDGLELRRSRRESRKVASYNENDLIDPLIDALEKTRSRATRKDKSLDKPLVEKPKLSSEELFDLLKKSACDPEVTNNVNTTFFSQLDSSNGADQDLPSDVDSVAFIEPAKMQDPDKIYEFTEDSPENTTKVFLKKKKTLPETNESNYCQICKKSFIRIENLIKHKTTLTHISKLSELEAKEAEEKARLAKEAEEQQQQSIISLSSILQPTIQVEEPLPLQNNHSLKLVDIISDVLNKPVLENYNEAKECDVRRYKSLGERKSFDSEVNNAPYMLPTTILEKQINLLENIIGNNLNNKPENSYIDEISSCSNVSDMDNNSCTTIFNVNSYADFIKPPIQYEEISEDSVNARVYEDPKQRKTLNRDEELFLECCSLLKSGSEVSNSIKNPANEPPMESRNLIQPVEEAREYSDNSRTPTPLGDTFDDDASNSNTISSNWHLNSEKTVDKNPSLSFEEVKNKEAAGMSFGEILTEGLKNQFENVAKINERAKEEDDCQKDTTPEQSPTPEDRKDDSDGSITGKKVATKGARKVYEGLRVSIPTEDLNLDVLNKKCDTIKTPPIEEQTSPSKPRSTRKSKPVKKSQVGSNLLFKVNKKRPIQTDIYNFEETQDNVDIFIKPQDINKKITPLIASDNESLGYADSIGADAKSVSSLSSISAMSTKKPPEPTTPESVTKKKSKIMGKIFKNAAKTKTDEIDEELRNIPEIPEIDNLELVENYVRSCQRVQSPFLPPPPPPAPLDQVPKKPKMTEEEMNLLFDQLLGKDAEQPEKTKATKRDSTKRKSHNNGNKVKHRKRARVNSESSDEFNINKSAKKRTNKKNNQDDSGINMELELKECIGVASRKSQRTCTSGKQNILVEYWSSDEEAFEAMLEAHKLPIVKNTEGAVFEKPSKPKKLRKPRKPKLAPKTPQEIAVATSNRRKRAAANPLYHWSSSSEDESQSLIEIKPIREEEDEDDRPVQHGWIVGDSPKKLVTMLALTKGKKTDFDSVKEQGKRRTSNIAS